MKKRPYIYKVSEGQSIEDVALTAYGDIEGVYLLQADNPGLTLDTELVAGQELNIVSAPISLDTVAYFQARGYVVNTGQPPVEPPDPNDTFDYNTNLTLS